MGTIGKTKTEPRVRSEKIMSLHTNNFGTDGDTLSERVKHEHELSMLKILLQS